MGIFRKDPNESAPAPHDADRVAAAASAAVTEALAKPDPNQAVIERERAKYRRPKESTRAFKVHTRALARKQRAGIEWTSDPQIVNAEDLTEAQAVELLNTPHLFVEELTSTSKDAVKPTGVGSPGGPSPDQLRDADAAPVPSSSNSPGARGNGPNVIGGMTAVETSTPPPRPPTRSKSE